MPDLRLSNVVASLSHALDLTEGQAPGHAVRSCAIGMEIASRLSLGPQERSDLYYALLLKDAGCSANSAAVAATFESDDHALKLDQKFTEWNRGAAAAAYLFRNAGVGLGLVRKLRAFRRLVRGGGPLAREFTRIRCERGAEIARDLGFTETTAAAIQALDEHWDGGGHPYGIAGTDIPVAARIACLSQTVDTFLSAHGPAEALTVVRKRRGTWFDPELADIVLGWKDRSGWWARVRDLRIGADVNQHEPGDRVRRLDAAGLDRIAEAFADVIDAKSPYTSDHSRGVARIARALGQRLDRSTPEQRRLYRAGLLHDIGKLAVSNRILDKPGKLTDEEFAFVRQHPAHSRDILGPVEAFADVLEPACYHHERLDGGGYPWGLSGERLGLDSRIVAVADVFEALTADRPYRESLPVDAVRTIMMRDAGHSLDGTVLDALFGGVAGVGHDPECGSGRIRSGAAGPAARRPVATP
jgi:HD-GYP domain-containing protein (c-di-GMP phosphodiesterase class II)